MIVRLTSRFHRDLHDIGEWISCHDPEAAPRIAEELIGKALATGDLPRGFPVVSRRNGVELRERTHGDYIILYRLNIQVEVLRAVHVRRDYLSLLQDL